MSRHPPSMIWLAPRLSTVVPWLRIPGLTNLEGRQQTEAFDGLSSSGDGRTTYTATQDR